MRTMRTTPTSRCWVRRFAPPVRHGVSPTDYPAPDSTARFPENPIRSKVSDLVVSRFCIGLFVLMAAGSALAEVELASPFTSRVGVRRDAKVPVWGTAATGERVAVEFTGQKIPVLADAKGE